MQELGVLDRVRASPPPNGLEIEKIIQKPGREGGMWLKRLGPIIA